MWANRMGWEIPDLHVRPRADFIQNDDIEVPGNIGTPEAREKLRFRLGEQVHIATPGAPNSTSARRTPTTPSMRT
ncbi:hypothetical protein SNK04_014108 [Fusarium graminearum]